MSAGLRDPVGHLTVGGDHDDGPPGRLGAHQLTDQLVRRYTRLGEQHPHPARRREQHGRRQLGPVEDTRHLGPGLRGELPEPPQQPSRCFSSGICG